MVCFLFIVSFRGAGSVVSSFGQARTFSDLGDNYRWELRGWAFRSSHLLGAASMKLHQLVQLVGSPPLGEEVGAQLRQL